jgi:hypothetical protein
MSQLSREISLVIAREFGGDEFLNRLSDPFWFQAFGCILGFDWHSSGLTTTVCAALKEGLKDISADTGIFVCGGKGAASRKTPVEIRNIAGRRLIKDSPERLIYSSRMSAKVDSTALQDGYQLYHHCFIFTQEGNWTVIQQGMNTQTRWARRYHWLGKQVNDFVCEPHKAICCDQKSKVLNMVAAESSNCRSISASLAGEKPEKVVGEFSLDDIKAQNLKKILQKTYERKPHNFEALLGIEGVGPKTIRALSLISELVYAKPASFKDPVRFSFAHGGKDGHPYPVAKKEYDLSIGILRNALNQAKIGRSDKLAALRRLNNLL